MEDIEHMCVVGYKQDWQHSGGGGANWHATILTILALKKLFYVIVVIIIIIINKACGYLVVHKRVAIL